MRHLRTGLYLGLAALTLTVYGLAEARGWALDDKRAPERVEPDQLRRVSPGAWTYVYWYHGMRGQVSASPEEIPT